MFSYSSVISSKNQKASGLHCIVVFEDFETHALDLIESQEILQVVSLSLEFINIACVI